jgi:hypothetical protein
VKRNYYYLVAGLQDISLDVHKLNYSQIAFREHLKEEVHPRDYELVEKLFLPYDNANVLNLLLHTQKPFDPRGNFSQQFLEENIKEPSSDLPSYMEKFIRAFKNKEPVCPEMSPENELTTLFYDQMLKQDNKFLRQWFEFNLNLRNVGVALGARRHNIPYENQIIGTGEVSDAIRRSHARDFGLGNDIEFLEEVNTIMRQDDIQVREKALDQLKWNYLDEVTFFEYFTIERILAFTIKLGIVERWLGIDVDHGREMFKKLMQELNSSYELPESFKEK